MRALFAPEPRADLLRALLLALGIGAVWALRDWSALTELRLSDTDDLMRLQQVRDWIGGQAFADLSQHRLGPSGVALHWSRLGDLGPAALILALRGWIGASAAEVAAVTLYPLLLFAAALFLIGQLARRLGGPASAPVAMLLGLCAFPMTALFLPGRIDHHGLQIVLLLALALSLTGHDARRSGLASGLLVGLSMAVGLEMAPLAVAAGITIALGWLRRSEDSAARLGLFGLALLLTTFFAASALRPAIWSNALCDGFTAPVARLLLVAGGAALVLGGAGETLPARLRLVFGSTAALLLAAAVPLTASVCLAGPYGAVDPLLAAQWLARVEEAQPLLALPLGTALGYAGVLAAGLATTAWLAHRDRRWVPLLLLQLAALATALVQVRAAPAGAALALPALAALIVAARERGQFRTLAAWLGSTGIVYVGLGGLATGATASPAGSAVNAVEPGCAGGPDAALAALAPGVVLAPIDLGPRILTTTAHRVLAAPYHRNAAGNRAALAFYAAPPAEARAAALRSGATYFLCPGQARDRFTPVPGAPGVYRLR